MLKVCRKSKLFRCIFDYEALGTYGEPRLPLTEDQEAQLSHLLQEVAPHRKKLTPWEQQFLDDHVARYEQYGSKIFISAKQWGVLKKIHEKATEGE